MRASAVIQPLNKRQRRDRQQLCHPLVCIASIRSDSSHKVKRERVITGFCTVEEIVPLHEDVSDHRFLLRPPQACVKWILISADQLPEPQVLASADFISDKDDVIYLREPVHGAKVCVGLHRLQHEFFWQGRRQSFVTTQAAAEQAGLVRMISRQVPLHPAPPIRSGDDDDDGNSNDDEAEDDDPEQQCYSLDFVANAVQISFRIKDQTKFADVVSSALRFARDRDRGHQIRDRGHP
jgi:hypothetical protein